MAENCITCDVAIVGSGFAGSLIANELSKLRIKVVILEAGSDVLPNFNDYMESFYMASSKVPESPYPPAVLDANGFIDPKTRAVGRPSSLTVGKSTWQDPAKAYLDQSNPDPKNPTSPFKSTYERLAGGTGHWMGLTPRLVPNDFRMFTAYVKDQPPPDNEDLAKDLKNFVDWPIGYGDIKSFYEQAEAELGVSANVEDQRLPGIDGMFPDSYEYPCREFRLLYSINSLATSFRS
jgi:choline dehydrogenase-like flavoprotein